MPSVGSAGDDVVQQALDTALNRDPCRKCWNKKALVRDSGPVSIQVAAGLRDLHCCQLCIRGFAVGPSVSASSPRSAERRCAALALQSKDLEQSARSSICVIRDALEDNATPNNATPNDETRRAPLWRLESCGINFDFDVRCPQNVADFLLQKTKLGGMAGSLQETDLGPQQCADGSIVATDGSIYCPVCDMTVNGQGQYDDHRNGMKHKKNMLKAVRGGSREQTYDDIRIAKGLSDNIISKDTFVNRDAEPELLRKDDASLQQSSADSTVPGLDLRAGGVVGVGLSSSQWPTTSTTAADLSCGRSDYTQRDGAVGGRPWDNQADSYASLCIREQQLLERERQVTERERIQTEREERWIAECQGDMLYYTPDFSSAGPLGRPPMPPGPLAFDQVDWPSGLDWSIHSSWQ